MLVISTNSIAIRAAILPAIRFAKNESRRKWMTVRILNSHLEIFFFLGCISLRWLSHAHDWTLTHQKCQMAGWLRRWFIRSFETRKPEFSTVENIYRPYSAPDNDLLLLSFPAKTAIDAVEMQADMPSRLRHATKNYDERCGQCLH